MRLFTLILGFMAVFLAVDTLAPVTALADGEQVRNPAAIPTSGSDAQFDKRLPPVLPGEEISDGKNKIKMWSTTGPVPVSEAPEPWKNGNGNLNVGEAGVGVIIDRGDDRSHRGR